MDVLELARVSSGDTFLIVMVVFELLLIGLATYLIFFVRHQHALGVCIPLSFAPLFIGCFRSLITLATAVTISESMRENSGTQPNFVMLIGVSLAPLLLGAVISAPAFLMLSLVRFYLSIEAYLPRRKSNEISDEETEKAAAAEFDNELANSYLAKLTRSR